MAGAATGEATSAPSVHALSSEISDLEVKGSVVTSSGSAASSRRRLALAQKMERLQNEKRLRELEKETVRAAEEERLLRIEMQEAEEEDVRQRLGESSSQSPKATPLEHPPGLDAAMRFSIATPGSSPAEAALGLSLREPGKTRPQVPWFAKNCWSHAAMHQALRGRGLLKCLSLKMA